ncbi:pentatricopeptide repeat-containing protein, partial [Tanacetum coccineum]
MPQKDFSDSNHNHLLFEYARANENVLALKHFLGIRRLGLPINGASFSCVLKICGSLCDEVIGKQVHCDCVKYGFVADVSVGTSLIDMYTKTEVEGVGMQRGGKAFLRMQVEGVKPNPFTFATILGALADSGAVVKGMQNSMNSSAPCPSSTLNKVKVPKELPKVSMVNTSLKKLKHHLVGFDKVVKERTTSTAITE